MEAEATAEGEAGGQAGVAAERRVQPRYAVDESATILLVSHGRNIAGQMIEMSVSGCRLRTPFPFTAGIKTQVEIAFRIHGIAFRFSGVVEWTRARQLGVRFLDVPSRRQIELFDALLETQADSAAKAAKEAARVCVAEPVGESRSREKLPLGHVPTRLGIKHQPVAESARPASMLPSAVATEMNATRQANPDTQVETATELILAPHDSQEAAHHSGRDRRTQSRVSIDTSADIHLINVGCRLAGRIQDLSVGGCRIHTDERFPVGIYTRVETEFRLQGLPFRLIGVIQAVHDQQRQVVGIRFLDMSTRKREQVEQLMKEIEEERREKSEL